MTQEQEHNERPRFGGPTAEQVGRARAGSGEGAGGRFERLRDALVMLLRRLGEKAASASRWLRRRLRFGLSSILDTFRRWSKGRGFGFWWLVVTLVLAGVVGVLVAALLTPVMGILAGLAVVVWLLIRKMTGNSHSESGDDHDGERGADGDKLASAATA